jgi:SSS family solute:Na+ symporter
VEAFTLISFLAFTALVAFVSWRATRSDDHETSTGYFLAGRSLSWIVIAGSLLLTNLSTEQLVGLNGGGLQHGMQVMAWEVWSSIAIVLMALDHGSGILAHTNMPAFGGSTSQPKRRRPATRTSR